MNAIKVALVRLVSMKMSRKIFLLSLLFYTASAFLSKIQAQEPVDRWWVFFDHKKNTPFSIDKPESFLSERALEKRMKFDVPITEADLPVDPQYLERLASLNLTLRHTSRWFNAVSVELDAEDEDLMATIEALAFVSELRPVGRRKNTNSALSSEKQNANRHELMARQQHSLVEQALEHSADLMDSEDEVVDYADYFGDSFAQLNQLCGPNLHLRGYTGEGILIAVMDAGFPDLPDFDYFNTMIAEGRLVDGFNYVDNDDNLFDHHKHGRNVFTIMGAYLPGIYIGAAPDASYVLFRTEDVASERNIEEDNWIAAAERSAEIGVDVINTSLGYSEFDDGQLSYTYAEMDGNSAMITRAADIAASKGILVVNSAGNEGQGNWKYITAPADGDSVLAVGGVDVFGDLYSRSSRGPSVDGRVKPNVCAVGRGTAFINASGTVENGSGTSYASPIVAGLAACLMQANPDKSSMEIFHAIEQSASNFTSPNDSLGYGIPNFCLADQLLKWQPSGELVQISPNPVATRFDLMFSGVAGETVYFELYDLSGRIHRSLMYEVPSTGGTKVSFTQLQDLPPGFYLLRMISEAYTKSIRVIKQ